MKSSSTKPLVTQSVKSAMQILKLFSLEHSELGVTAISRRLQLPKSTTHRLITLLIEEQFLERCTDSRRYKLGRSLLSLSGVIMTQMDIHKEAIFYLEELVSKLGEAAHVCTTEGTEIVYLHKVEGRTPVNLSAIGRKNPVYYTSSGKCILAYQPKHIVSRVFDQGLKAYGEQGMPDLTSFIEQLNEIKYNGFAVCKNELHDGMVSIAVPIRDYSEQVIAAISMVGPEARLTEDKILLAISALQRAGKLISGKLGYFTAL